MKLTTVDQKLVSVAHRLPDQELGRILSTDLVGCNHEQLLGRRRKQIGEGSSMILSWRRGHDLDLLHGLLNELALRHFRLGYPSQLQAQSREHLK